MDSFTKGGINMDGSSDLHYRYKMPAILVKHEGKGKMNKSVLLNIKAVCESIGRPADYLLTYLGQTLNATTKLEKNPALSYVTGHHDQGQVQEQVLKFIKDTVMCRCCDNHCPETSCYVEGSKKRQSLFLHCKGCGRDSYLDTSDRFIKYMISHPAEAATYGHATQANTTSTTPATIVEKKECPECHHKTSKSTCSKCGATVASVNSLAGDATEQPAVGIKGRKECPRCEHKTSKAICSKCGTHMGELASIAEDGVTKELTSAVRPWMAAMEASNDGVSLEDFEGHITTACLVQCTPLHQLGAVVQVIVGLIIDRCGSAPVLQPKDVAQQAEAIVKLWSWLIEQLCVKIGDGDAAVDTILVHVHEGVGDAASGDRLVVGLLLALRDVSCVADGLLEGCRRLTVQSVAMKKFVEFLQGQEEEESDEMDDSQSEGAKEE